MGTKTLTLMAGVAALSIQTLAGAQTSPPSWTTTWQVAMQTTNRNFNSPQTERAVFHTSISGNAARVRLSNDYGDSPVTIQDVHIALSTGGSSIDPASDRPMTFNDSSSITIPARAHVVSDPVAFNVPALGDVAVSVYIPNPVSQTTGHQFAQQNNFLAYGDVSNAAAFPATDSPAEYYFVEALDVQNPQSKGTLVVLGASLTDGYASDFGQNDRWSNDLAVRFANAGLVIGVANAGISGNGLVQNGSGTSGAERFDNEVLRVPGIRWVDISDLLLNDLGATDPSTPASNYYKNLRQLTERAHQHGVLTICSTLTPFKGWPSFNAQTEANREQINAAIRANHGLCDYTRDADAAIRDPNDPQQIARPLNSDNIHPNGAGYQAIANAVPLGPFQGAAGSNSVPILAWVGAGGHAMENLSGISFGAQTIRTIAHTSVAGSMVRIEVSNTFNDQPLLIGAAHVGLSAGGAAVAAGTDRIITFNGGDASFQVPPGGKALSDPISMPLGASSDLAVSLYLPNGAGTVTGHGFGNQNSFIADGDVTGSVDLPNASTSSQIYFLSAVNVVSANADTISVFGGSLADGWGSSFSEHKAWPDVLAARLVAAGVSLGVNDQGSVGNRMLSESLAPNVLSRFNRDAIQQAGTRWLLIAEAPLNDIAATGPSLDDLKEALHQVIAQAHDKNIKVMCATLTPYNGFGAFTQAGEATRTGYNAFIRSGSNGCDATTDPDAAVRSPDDASKLNPAYDLGDHIDVNDAGAQAIANAVNLSAFE